MKRLFLFIISIFLVVSLLIPNTSISQTKQGKIAVLFTFNGLSYIGTTPFNGGVGLKYYLLDDIALRGSLGGSYISNENENTKYTNLNLSAAVLLDILGTENTNAYLGGEILYDHQEPIVNNIYSIAGIVGGEFFPWKNVSLSTEYKILINRDNLNKLTNVTLGKNIANFTLAIYFN